MTESLLAGFPGMVYRCFNDDGWSMRYISAGGESLTGYPREAFLESRDLDYADLIHAEDRQRVRQEIESALRVPTCFALTYRIMTADGKVIRVNEHGSAIRYGEGQVLALQGFVMDLTETWQAQPALDGATQRLKTIAQVTNDGIRRWNLRTSSSWWNNGLCTQFDLFLMKRKPGAHPDRPGPS